MLLYVLRFQEESVLFLRWTDSVCGGGCEGVEVVIVFGEYCVTIITDTP